MTNYLVGYDGNKTSINDDLFSMLWNSIDDEQGFTTDSDKSEKRDRTEENYRNNKKNRESGYFRDYYKKNHKIVMCEGCGCLVNNTNLSKHKKTNKCKMLTQAKKEKELEYKIQELVLHD